MFFKNISIIFLGFGLLLNSTTKPKDMRSIVVNAVKTAVGVGALCAAPLTVYLSNGLAGFMHSPSVTEKIVVSLPGVLIGIAGGWLAVDGGKELFKLMKQ